MISHLKVGKEGENFAVKYLKKNGYRIIGRNEREKWGELDVVAIAPDKTLVFVEVKTSASGIINPEEEMTYSKIEKFKRAAAAYACSHEKLIDEKKGWRLDVIALSCNEEGGFSVNHYENI